MCRVPCRMRAALGVGRGFDFGGCWRRGGVHTVLFSFRKLPNGGVCVAVDQPFLLVLLTASIMVDGVPSGKSGLALEPLGCWLCRDYFEGSGDTFRRVDAGSEHNPFTAR